MSSWIEPFSVKGDYVSVVPLTKKHRPDLEEAAREGSLHQLWFTSVPEPQSVEEITVPSHKRKKRGRKKLPADLPRVDEVPGIMRT